jgi:hypothetical protein
MRVALPLLAFALPLCAQQPSPPQPAPPNVAFSVQMEPAPAAFAKLTTSTSRAREGSDTVIRVWAYRATGNTYWGCEVLLKPMENDDAYFARFRALTVTAPDFIENASRMGDLARWKLEAPPAWPAPQRIAAGETLAVDLMVDRKAGESLTGYLRLQKRVPVRAVEAEIGKMSTPELRDFEKRVHERIQVTNDAINDAMLLAGHPGATVLRVPRTPPPAVIGLPRDFAADDSEIRIAASRVLVNGVPQVLSASARGPVLRGPITWLYLPGRGRFLVSLAAHSGFAPSGAVQGRLMEVKDGQDSIAIESLNPIAADDGTYIVYVKNEKEWRPESGQLAGLQFGAMKAGESTPPVVR